MVMNIILLSGYKGSGKDYVSDIICEYFGFHKIAIAKELKDFISEKYNIEREILDDPYKKDLVYNETSSYRDLLVYHAEEAKKVEPEIWIKKAVDRINSVGLENIVISDWRFPVEYHYIVKEFKDANIITARIINKYMKSEESYSETCLDTYSFKNYIDNSVYNDKSYIINQLREKIMKNLSINVNKIENV